MGDKVTGLAPLLFCSKIKIYSFMMLTDFLDLLASVAPTRPPPALLIIVDDVIVVAVNIIRRCHRHTRRERRRHLLSPPL